MDQVLARVKRLRKNPYKKLLSDTTLFAPIDTDAVSQVGYNPDHNLDDDSWFAIENFSGSDFFLEELKSDIDAKDYNDLGRDKFKDISHLMCIQGDDIYFQKITPSSHIKRKMIRFGEAAQLVEGVDHIVIKAAPDAVYFRNKDLLIFRDLAAITSIFDGIDQIYKEATEAEVRSFLALDFLKINGPFDTSLVSKPNRKRLALVADTLKEMSEAQRSSLIDYVKNYCEGRISITEDGTQFELSTDPQLKLILYGIAERFYTTQHSQEKRLANSVESLGR